MKLGNIESKTLHEKDTEARMMDSMKHAHIISIQNEVLRMHLYSN